MTSSLSQCKGKLPSPFNFLIQGHFRSILLDDFAHTLAVLSRLKGASLLPYTADTLYFVNVNDFETAISFTKFSLYPLNKETVASYC